jgi:hypothetical protein
MRLVRQALPTPVRRLLGGALRRGRDTIEYLRGKSILRSYAAHHLHARRIFMRDGCESELSVESLRNLGIRVILPDVPGSLISLPDDYHALVARVADAARIRLRQSRNCRFFPGVSGGVVPERTDDIAAVRNGEVIAIQLVDPIDLDGVSQLCAPIMKELERKVFGSYAIVDKVYVYRSPVSRQNPRASWLWHYDNHPPEILKVMIYLTDVHQGTAPFEYLRRTGSSVPVHGSPIAPFYGTSRISDQQVHRQLAAGCEQRAVLGPAGTMLIFDSNILHRGTLARDGHRDVLVFQVRPVTFRAEPYISERWTGSVRHVDVHRDPRDITPRKDPLRNPAAKNAVPEDQR